MTAQAAASPVRVRRDYLGAWCGSVMLGASVLVPVLGWLAPLGFAALLGLMGLLMLPALRVTDEDRPVLVVLLGALLWAAVSSTASPYHPKRIEQNLALQLGLSLPLFWSAICGARRADPRLNALALRVLAWGCAIFGGLLIADTLTDAHIYKSLHERWYEPIRIDLAETNVAHASFVLALLWPAVLGGQLRRRLDAALLVVAALGTVMAAHAFRGDAPVLALPLCAATMIVVWRWPQGGPRWMAAKVAAVGFLMPGLIWLVRAAGSYGELEQATPLSWSARLSYWSHTIDWIGQRPLQGWGLDASRAMGPGIQLHPHNTALQIWLELGVVGAVAAAAFWGLSLIRLSRPQPDVRMAGVAGSATAFILFAWINYGAWQSWWLALGALVAVIAAMLTNSDPKAKST